MKWNEITEVKVDRRKARRLKRRMAKKIKFMNLDEGYLIYPELTKEMKEHIERTHRLTNQHLINEKGEMQHSATVVQSINDFL